MTQPSQPDKAPKKGADLYSDRWSSHALNDAILEISNQLTAAELAGYDIFEGYNEKFLDKISADVAVVDWKEGALLFEEGSYIDLAFFVVSGKIDISLEIRRKAGPQTGSYENSDVFPETGHGTMVLDMVSRSKLVAGKSGRIAMLSSMDVNLDDDAMTLGPGELFGEIGALSGWPQSVTARAATQVRLVQIRLPALRLMKTRSPKLKERLDRLYRERGMLAQLNATTLFSGLSDAFLKKLVDRLELVSLSPGEHLLQLGGAVDALYIVRSGFIKLMQRYGEAEMVVSYLSKGMTFGEVELLMTDLPGWQSAAVSVEYAELIKIPKPVLGEILRSAAGVEDKLWKNAGRMVKEAGYSRRRLDQSQFTEQALDLGLVQGNSILVIDLEACTRCDDCVRACAATHGGRPRFVREGKKLGSLLIPRSCYHCRDPVCLVGCPTGAIHRTGISEVIKVDEDICIGCATCANNCPYDAIVMNDTQQIWPEDTVPAALSGTPRFQASKCDLCQDTGHEPACVANCPQGCAGRVGSIEELRTWCRED